MVINLPTVRRAVLGVTLLLAGISAGLPAAALEVTRVVSAGGIEAWLVEDHTVPVISLNATFPAGAALDPAGREGRASLLSSLLDEGAGELTSQNFQERLADISARLRFSASRDRFGARLRTLSANREEAFDLLRLALTAPRFDPGPVARIRAQTIAGLRAELQDPDTIAGRTWFRTAFPDHPYGRPVDGTVASVRAITVADLRAFVSGYFARDGLKIGVAGDITPKELARRLDRIFGALAAKGRVAAIAAVQPANAGKQVIVRRKVPQSVVVFGHAGIRRDDPDWYAAYVMNRIFGGGGFSSRLTEEVREKRGLAYGVYSYLSPYRHAALMMGGVATANRRVGKSLEVIRTEWKRMAEHGVTVKELAEAKTYINGSFPLRLDSSRRIAGLLVAMQIHDLGIDYVSRRPALINAITLGDISRVARRLMKPDALTVVVVGQPNGLTSP
ncbi:MAG: pitrilysin family protein [Alphaproteobacteria bacterium]